MPLLKPHAVLYHLRPLGRGRLPLAGGRFFAVGRSAHRSNLTRRHPPISVASASLTCGCGAMTRKLMRPAKEKGPHKNLRRDKGNGGKFRLAVHSISPGWTLFATRRVKYLVFDLNLKREVARARSDQRHPFAGAARRSDRRRVHTRFRGEWPEWLECA
jgi:hypothetical protein